jgi:hypothetical protein
MRALRVIAAEIESDPAWSSVTNAGARSMLAQMRGIGIITDPFKYDPDGYGVVASFLGHAIGWRGPAARRIKKELYTMCGHPRYVRAGKR